MKTRNFLERINDMKELEQYANDMAKEYWRKADNDAAFFGCVEMMEAYQELAKAARKMQGKLEKRYGRNLDRLEDIEARELLR